MIFKNITNYRDRREKAEAQFQSILSNALGNFDRLKKQIWLIDHKNYNIFLSSFFLSGGLQSLSDIYFTFKSND